MSCSCPESKHSVYQWEVRQYENDETGGLTYDFTGKVLNKLVWEDPKIAEGTNFNVVTDVGKELIDNTIFGLAGSGTYSWMAYGASSTAAAHTDTHLTYELIADGTRIILTNQSGTIMTSGSVVGLNTFNDTSYSPTLVYYVQAIVMGTINGGTTLNVNQPVQELAIVSAAACPGTPSGTSGVILNHYILGAVNTLTNTTTLQIIVTLRS